MGRSRSSLVQRSSPAVIALVKTWAARFETRRAREMGFTADADVMAIVRAYVEDNPAAVTIRR
jgi:hypothetical protein